MAILLSVLLIAWMLLVSASHVGGLIAVTQLVGQWREKKHFDLGLWPMASLIMAIAFWLYQFGWFYNNPVSGP